MKKLLVTLVFISGLSRLFAATFYVAPGGVDSNSGDSWPKAKQTIQAAVAVAIAGDSIVVTNGAYGPINTANKAITIQSVNGADVTIIDGGGTRRVATLGSMFSHTNTTIKGFTLQNGHADKGGGSYGGTLDNCTLIGNRADDGYGGGSYFSTLNNCTLIANAAEYGGGSYYSTLNNCTLIANTAKYGGGSNGGVLNNCTLSSNTAEYGGGSYDVTLNNCTLSSNTAKFGGGSYSGTLNSCTLSGNTANDGYGGGSTGGTLNNCIISGNTASGGGGGSAHGTLNNCTVTDNATGDKGGGSFGGTRNNCIIWGNHATLQYDNIIPLGSTVRYTLSDEVISGEGNIAGDPLFVDAANGDFRLLPESPCINAGANALISSPTDIAGNPRIRGGRVDMGAYESSGSGSTTPYLNDESASEAAPLTLAGAYNGFVYDDAGTVGGTLTLTAKAAVRKITDRATREVTYTTNWTISAKVILQSATLSFSAKEVGPFDALTLNARSGETLALTFGEGTLYGALTGGRFAEAVLNVAGSRNAFADRRDTAAQERLAQVKGLYTVALVTDEAAHGYLSLTAGAAGAVKLAGVLADGTKVSAKANLLESLNSDGWQAIALYKPLYIRKGSIGGLLWLNPEDKIIRLDTAREWFIDWVSTDERRGVFAYELDVIGGAFTGLGEAGELTFSALIPGDLPPPLATLESGAWIAETFPLSLPASVSGGRLALPRGVAPKRVKVDDATGYDYSGENSSLAKITYNTRTGIFKGSFKLYYDGLNARGAPQHKAVGATYQGVVVPLRDETYATAPLGLGFGVTTINRQKYPLPVFLGEFE